MAKKLVMFPVMFILLFSFAFAAEDTENAYSDLGEVALLEDAGLTPDNPFYFLDGLFEAFFVGNNPEKALKYKEEKINEARQMVAKGKVEAAKKAFAKAEKYNNILQREVSPEIEKRVRESSKATKEVMAEIEDDLEGEEWEDVRELAEEQKRTEDKIALAAKVSSQIEGLCKTLSELDPVEYARVCKTEDDGPKWQKELDKELTKKQKKEAKEFFETMSGCFKNPKDCECDKINIKSFADKCSEIVPLAAECMEGDEDACDEMDDMEDPIDLLPAHLQKAMEDVEDKFREVEFDNHMPEECQEEGATTRKECEEIIFIRYAPEECSELYKEGKLDFKNEKEAGERCDELMFKEDAPEECIEAGLNDRDECEKFIFSLDAPQECLDAGLTGEGRNDWKKCDLIRFKMDAPQECLDAGLTGEKRDDWKKCEAIKFKMDAPQECLDAGIDMDKKDAWKECEAIKFQLEAPQECLDAGIKGRNKNDWKKCDIIRFKMDSPEECLEAGLTGEGRDDWKKCEAIKFQLEAPQECLDAGLTGEGRKDWNECEIIRFELESPQECIDAGLTGRNSRDWDKCNVIRFELEAPQECLDAGITGRDRRAWNKCNEITEELKEKQMEEEERKRQKEEELWEKEEEQKRKEQEIWEEEQANNECRDGCEDECGNLNSRCVDGNRCECYEGSGQKSGGSEDSCAAVLCQEGYFCDDGNCIFDPKKSECADGCEDECGDARWDCSNGYCECFYDDFDELSEPEIYPEQPEPKGQEMQSEHETAPESNEPEETKLL